MAKKKVVQQVGSLEVREVGIQDLKKALAAARERSAALEEMAVEMAYLISNWQEAKEKVADRDPTADDLLGYLLELGEPSPSDGEAKAYYDVFKTVLARNLRDTLSIPDPD